MNRGVPDPLLVWAKKGVEKRKAAKKIARLLMVRARSRRIEKRKAAEKSTRLLMERAKTGVERREAAQKSARLLILKASLGNEIGVKAHIVRMLWRSGVLEERVAARLLIQYFKTGLFTKPTVPKPERMVECHIVTADGQRKKKLVPRNEIALYESGVYPRPLKMLTTDGWPGSFSRLLKTLRPPARPRVGRLMRQSKAYD